MLEKLTFAWVKPFIARALDSNQKVRVADLDENLVGEDIGSEVDELN